MNRKFGWSNSAAAFVLAMATAAVGQQAQPDGENAKESLQGVYVRDSAVAAEKMALGERMERLKEWDKAANIFQEILEKYADRVVQDSHGTRYTSVVMAVQERLSKWPDDGLKAYRARYEGPASDALSSLKRDDYAGLDSIFRRYFVTEAGKTAGLRMIDLYLENGEFSAAAWLGDRLLETHPNLTVERPRVLYRVAIAYSLAGEKEKAKQRADELKTSFPTATGTVRGQDVTLADSLEKDLASASIVTRTQSAESWPMLMGDPSRSRVSTGVGRAGARPFSSIEITHSSFNPPPELKQEMDSVERNDHDRGLDVGIIPSVEKDADRTDLYFQDGFRLYAIDLDSGEAPGKWVETYSDAKGRYTLKNVPPPSPFSRRQQYTVSVTEKDVLAVMGPSPRATIFSQNFGNGNPFGLNGDRFTPTSTRLVCLDRATGAERWTASTKDFPEQGNVRSLALCGSPVVVGDSVYVCGTGGKGGQFDDCYVFCLDLATGKHKWSAYVCSATTGQAMWGGEGGGITDTIASVSYSSGRLYVLTNLGAVASLDAYSGGVVWLDIYDRSSSGQSPRFINGLGNDALANAVGKPWAANPAVVSGGNVFALPSDGKSLIVYDAATGQRRRRISLADLDNADTLVGVQQNKIVVSSEFVATAFNWEICEEGKKVEDTDAVFWKSTFPNKSSAVRGRAFMTADSVFVPTQDRLFRIDTVSGKIDQPYPPYSRDGWQEPEGPGNVLVTENKVVVAGPSRVNVYMDISVARAKLDEKVKQSPDDADLRLRYAEMMFAAGDVSTAMTKLDEALKLLGGEESLTPGPSRDRAFHTALGFAQRLADPADRDKITRLFDEASHAASGPNQQVQYRAARAQFASTTGDSATQINLYQEILADDAMRQVALADPDGTSSQLAGVLAEAQIASTIAKVGTSVYDPFEQQAHQAMDTAKSHDNPDELLNVARQFPNATVAMKSMLAAADTYEAKGDSPRATQVLRQIYFKYPQAPEKGIILESLARNYLATPGHVEVALSRLTHAAKLPGATKLAKPLKLPDGKVLERITLAEAVEDLKKIRSARESQGLPDFKWPASAELAVTAQTIPGIAALIPSMGLQFARADRVVAFTSDQTLALYSIGSPEPQWKAKGFTQAPQEYAWMDNKLVVWSAGNLAAIAPDTGNILWQLGLKNLPEAQLVAGKDNDNAEVPPNGPVNGPMRVIRGPNGQVRIINNGGILRINGRVVINGVVIQNNAAPVQAVGGDEKIVSAHIAGDKIIAATSNGRILAVNLADGHVAWQSRLSVDHAIERLMATDDFVAVRFNDGTNLHLVAMDAATGQVVRRWAYNIDGNGLPVAPPINQTLAPDGTFVVSFNNQIIATDLYEPSTQSKWQTVPTNGSYAGLDGPDQLIAADGRVLAVCDTGTFVRVLSLETGQPLHAKAAGGGGGQGPAVDQEVVLATAARSGTPTHLKLVGTSLYVFGPQSLRAYDLASPLATGERQLPEEVSVRDVVLGSEQAVAVTDAGGPRFIGNADAPSTDMQLLVYSRTLINGQESGLLTHDPKFHESAGIVSWQGINGGMAYVTADQKLRFVKPKN